VGNTLSADLIERCAQAEGVERKDVVNLVFHMCFARRDYLPQNAKGRGNLDIAEEVTCRYAVHIGSQMSTKRRIGYRADVPQFTVE
jgi:hypothetical protein